MCQFYSVYFLPHTDDVAIIVLIPPPPPPPPLLFEGAESSACLIGIPFLIILSHRQQSVVNTLATGTHFFGCSHWMDKSDWSTRAANGHCAVCNPISLWLVSCLQEQSKSPCRGSRILTRYYLQMLLSGHLRSPGRDRPCSYSSGKVPRYPR